MLLIRIDLEPGGEQLAVRGYTVVEDENGWSETQQAEDLIARDGTIALDVSDTLLSGSGATLTPRAAGVALWKNFFGGEVGTWWQATSEGCASSEMRTVLDVCVAELQSVPWELIAPEGRAPVFRNHNKPWVRPRKTPWRPTDEFLVPLKVLVIVGSTEDDLEIDDELAAVHAALREVPCHWHIETKVNPTRAQLRDALANVEPHIVHFIAHGLQKDGASVLAMRRGLPGQWSLSPEDIDDLPRPAPRLIILDACRTADAAHGQEAAWRFTDAFFTHGAAAVIAMQGDITSAAAAVFAKSMYADLARGIAVDVATSRARQAVDDAATDGQSGVSPLCWALPRLTVEGDPEHVLPVKALVEKMDFPPFSETFKDVPNYVDRSSERRDLWTALDPCPDSPAPGLVVVSGPNNVGKSAMIKTTLMTLRLRGRHVAYLDFTKEVRSDDRASWLVTLLLIRKAIWEWNKDDASMAARRLFDHNLYYLKQHQDPPPLSADASPQEPTADFPVAERDHEKYVTRIFAAFREMLSTAMDGAPLLVVLDNSRSRLSADDGQKWLSPLLLQPLAEGHVANVRAAIVGTDADLNAFGPAVNFARNSGPHLKPFKREEVGRLAREYYARKAITIDKDGWWSSLRDSIERSPREDWGGDLYVVLNSFAAQS